jgi:hypothetical protein
MHRALQGRCGIFCGDCEIYIAYSTGNTEAQERIAKELSSADRTVSVEQIKCLGCKGTVASVWRSGCKLRLCAEDNGLEFCYQCRDYPCDELERFFENHPQAKENLRLISKIGPDAWLQKMMMKSKSVD